MINKCANPECEVPFRYLHEGRLFVIEDRGDTSVCVGPNAASAADGKLSYYWLCDSCCKMMIVAVDRQNGLRLVPVHCSSRQQN